MRHLTLVLALLLSGSPAAAQQTRTNPRSPHGRLLVSGFDSDAAHSYRTFDGAPRASVAAPGAQCTFIGPDGLLYVCAEQSNQVLRFDVDTLAPLGIFVGDDPLTPADENGPLNGPTAASFGPGGELFVASSFNNRVLRYDLAGNFVDQLLTIPRPYSLAFRPRSDELFVVSLTGNNVRKFDGLTGAALGTVVPSGSAGLLGAVYVSFLP